MLGIKHVFVVLPAPSSTSAHPKFILGAFWNQTLKGKLHQKSRNARFYHPKLKSQVFAKKLLKERGMRKEGTQDPPSEVQSCRFLKRELWKEKEMRKAGIQDRASKVHNWRFLNGKLCLKGKVHEKSRNPRSYHPKFILAAVWKGNFEKNRRFWKGKEKLHILSILE